MANYTKRADGRYQSSITIGRNPNGSPKRKYFYGDTIKELRTKISLFEEELRSGSLSGEDTLFEKAAEVWKQDYKYATNEKAGKRYERVIALHLSPLAKCKLKELLPLNLQSIINSMAQEAYSQKTLKEVKQTAVQILDMAADNGLIRRNVFKNVKIPKIAPKQRLPISNQMRELIESTWEKHRMGIPVLILLYCGLRKGELLALLWQDIDLKNKYIDVNKTVTYISNQPQIKPPKTEGSIRRVPIPDILLSILSKNAGKPADPVCPASAGKIMSEIAFRRAWESYQHFLNIEAGGHDATRSQSKLTVVEPFTAHQLRHTYATILYDAGVDVLAAQRFLGHADVETTLSIYTHLTEERQALSLDALNSSLKGKTLK